MVDDHVNTSKLAFATALYHDMYNMITIKFNTPISKYVNIEWLKKQVIYWQMKELIQQIKTNVLRPDRSYIHQRTE